ncbi:hypothetical protein J6590_043630 [Homalodisca vitripennis]|nr:hypothetical protein J6590_043630 [Homalodisca vitripennis]
MVHYVTPLIDMIDNGGRSSTVPADRQAHRQQWLFLAKSHYVIQNARERKATRIVLQHQSELSNITHSLSSCSWFRYSFGRDCCTPPLSSLYITCKEQRLPDCEVTS